VPADNNTTNALVIVIVIDICVIITVICL